LADVNAEIGVNINTSNALAQLKALQREIARFHASVAKSSEAAALAQRDLQKNFLNGVNAIQGFSAELRTVKTTAENFTDSLERNKFSMREYFRYSMASTKTFGRLFKSELDTVNKVAEEGVKRLQTQYIKMGRDANGAMKAIAVMPTKLNLNDFATQTQLAAQKQAIFNQLIKQGSTNLLNFGKNTQWAGRQLMVGFTIPLIGLGTAASRTFMDMETAAIKFKKVYGDLFTATEERDQALKDIEELGNRFTKYGIALADTVGLAAEAAAAGFKGIDLQRQVTEATRLQVLGQIEQQKALETTISLQNAFRLSSADLADSINFLNAVENQTVVSLDDITTAIPKAAPIVRELGGDVKDLAFFMAAMKEGGINASEGANALKSGLASLINPSDKARAMLSDFGIDIDAIVNKNAGNVKQTVVDFAVALDDLSSLSRQRAIEQLFGKFQQARLSALFDNVIRDGNQASRVLDLAGTSTEELAALAEQELGITANSSMNKFRKSVEDLKAALVPVGQLFLEIVTPFLENIGNILDKFNDLSAGTKRVIGILTIGLGAIAPVVLMTVGLFANFVANGIKGLMLLRNGYLRLTGQSQILSEQTNFLTVEQQQALAAAASLEQSHMRLQQVFTGEAASVRALIAEYQRMIAAQNMAATRFPGMMVPGFKPKGYIDGVVSVPGPKGAGDVVPAMLSPGEAVIPEPMNKKYAPLVQGIIADRIPGFQTGVSSVAERFLATRAGRSASGGERAQVNIPGGYQLGHFAEVIQVTGEELRRLAETQSKGFKDTVERMITSVNGDLQHMFDIFTNEVTVQSKEFNQALGEIGSGKKAPVSMFREEAVFQSGAYNAPLIREMKKAGASTEEVDSAVRQLAQEFDTGISELGQVTEVTAEEVNSITQAAYERVSAVNEKVRVARERLQDPGAIKEILGVTSGRTPFAGGYNTRGSREDINEVVQEQMPGLYPTQQAFNFTGEAARKVGVQNAIAIREIYTQLGAEAQARVRALIGDIDAMSQQVVLEAKNSGIDIGRYAIQGITTGIDAASPSQKARQQGQNVADGFEQGILEGMDDASMAGQKLGDAATQGIGLRDLTTDIRYTQGTLPGLNVSNSAENLTESLDDLDSVTIQAADTTASSGANLAKWNSRLMSTSFALSSISGIAMAFGNNLGGLGEKVFQVSSVMFALQGVVQLLTQAKLLELAATRLAAAKQAAAFATYGAGMASRAGMAGMLGRVGVFAKTLLGLTNPVGWVITGLTVAAGLYVLINNRLEANRKKIDGLGDAALIAGKKLETLEQFFGTDFKRFTSEGFKYSEETAAAPGLVAARRQQADALIANKDFQKDFKDTIDALRSATTSEAQLVLEGISMQLQARGATKEQIQTITDALIKEAGKTDIVLDFAKIDISTKEGQGKLKKNVDEILKEYNKAFAKGINDSYKRTLNLAGKSIAGAFGALQLQLEDGSISAKEYADQINNINKQILSMPDSQAKLNLVNAVFDAMGEDAKRAAEGVTNLNNKLLLAQAIMLGVADAQSIRNLSSPLFFVQDVAARTLSANIEKYFKQLSSGLSEIKEGTDDNNSSNGKGITLQEKLIKIYQNQVKGLEKKLKALRDVNEEIDRQNQFMKDQVDLDKQITEAKISGNYLEAAALSQQKLYNQAEFNRETQELEIQKQIDQINDRISYLEDKGKKAQLTAAEKKLLGLETKSKAPKANTTDDKKKKENDKKQKENADAAASVTTTITTTKSASGSPDQARKDYENRPGNRKIPLPPPVQTGTKDYYFNTKTGKWELITRSSKTPVGYVSRQDYARGKNTYAQGGLVKGPGTGTSDSIFAMVDGYASGGMIRVSNGEYIFSKKAIDNAGGPKAIDAIHQRLRKAPAFRDGGLVGKSQPGDMANLDGQMVRINRGTQKQILADIKAAYAAEPNVKAFKDRIDYFKAIKEWDNKYSFVIPSQKSYPIAGGEHPLGSLSRFISVAKSQAAGGSYDAFYDATIASHAFKFFSPQVDRQVKDLLDSSPSEVFNRIGEIENLNKFSIASNKAYKLGNDLIAWCGAFVAWVAEQSGVNISKKMFSAFGATQEYKDLGTFKDPGSSLNVGDVVWWDWAKKFAAGSSKYKDATPGVPDHVDIITDKIGKSTFTTVGGGFGGSVGKRNINFSKEAQALYGSVTPEFQSFKDGGPVKPTMGTPDPNQSFINKLLFGTKYIGGNMKMIKGEVPFGPGSSTKFATKFKDFNIDFTPGTVPSLDTVIAYHKNAPVKLKDYFDAIKSGAKWPNITEHPAYEAGGTLNALRAYISGSNKSVGELSWDPLSGVILNLNVDKMFRRQGLASKFWEIASKISPISHSVVRSVEGDDWARSVGGILPDLQHLVPKMAMGGYVNMASLPKFKNGIDNVPYDMPAILHKNERVLTAEENKRYGETNSTINATFNIAGGNSDEIVNKVMVKLNTLTNKNNKSNKVAI
jgi:TP901 family phage tail tape measure protein